MATHSGDTAHAEHLREMVRPTAVVPTSASHPEAGQQAAETHEQAKDGGHAELSEGLGTSADQVGNAWGGAVDGSAHHAASSIRPRTGNSVDLGKLILPAITALGAAALLWLKVRSSKAKPASPASPATKKTSGTKAGTPRKGSGSKRQAQARQAEGQAPAAAETAQADSVILPEEEPEEEILPDEFAILAAPLELLPPAPTTSLPLPLSDMSFVVSENVDVEGSITSYGIQEWSEHCDTASGTAPVVSRSVSAGAACIGKAAMQPAGLNMVCASFGNLFNKTRVTGGGHTGAALHVGTGQSHFALCDDSVGEARVPAACCALYAYRPTPGVFGGVSANSAPGSRAAQQLSTVSVLAKEVNTLQKVAQVLNAPGSSNIKGEMLHCVVAQDMCEMCAPELQPAIYATKKAIIKWAGSDQAGAVQLVRFLSSHVTSWHDLIPGKPLTKGFDAIAGGGIHVDDFLQSALVACEILRAEQLHEQAGHIQAAVTPPPPPPPPPAAATTELPPTAAEPAAAPDAGPEAGVAAVQEGPELQDGDVEEQPAVEAERIPETVTTETADGAQVEEQAGAEADQPAESTQGDESAPAVEQAPEVSAETVEEQQAGGVLPPRPSSEQLAAAKAFASEVHECLRTTVKPDTIMVLPVLPFVPPKRVQPEPLEFLMFSKLSQSFSAIASLAGCPTLTCPVGNLRDGSPVAICLMAVHKFDQRLLAVAGKLCPLIKETFHAVREEITQMAQKQELEAAGAAPAASNGSHSQSAANGDHAAPGTKPGAAAQQAAAKQGPGAAAAPSPPVDPKKAEKAEKAKAKGNEQYQAGKYVEAMNEYTRAISLHPSCHVYYSNRAMACIKLFRFEQAEEDCNRALSFDLTDKDKVKALLRRATARDALQKYEGAEQDLRSVLRLEPNNKQAREDLQALRQHQSQMAQSQAAMVSQMRAQQAGGGLPPGGLPMGIDPSMFPPGFFGMDGGDMAAAYEE